MKWFVPLILLLVCAAVFGRVVQNDFVRWDDDAQVYRNPGLNPPSAAHLADFWRAPYDKLYIPVSYTVFSGLAALAHEPKAVRLPDAVVTTLNPHVFHLAGLFLHLACTLLVYALLRRFVHSDWAAGAGALLFALHPVQVEAVAWASELRGLLAALFSLLALLSYLRYADGAGRRFFAVATVCFLLALLSKPSAVILPLVAGALDLGLLRRPWPVVVKPLALWLTFSLALLLVTRSVQPVPPELMTPLWTRPLIALDSLTFYLGKLLWPSALGIDYGRTPAFVLAQPREWATALIPIGLGLLFLWLRRRRLLVAVSLFVAALLPVLGLIPFVFQSYSTVADRYLYLALLGPALCLAWGMDVLTTGAGGCPRAEPLGWERACCPPSALATRRARARTKEDTKRLLLSSPTQVGRRLFLAQGFSPGSKAQGFSPGAASAWAGCAALMLLLGGRSAVQVGCWQNSVPLFTQALVVNPESWFVHTNLGNVLVDQGDFNGAIRQFQAASVLRPDEARPHFNLAGALLQQGDIAGAESQYRAVVRLRPDYPLAHNNLGCLLSRQGQWAEASAEFQAALHCDPSFTDARRNLGIALAHQRG